MAGAGGVGAGVGETAGSLSAGFLSVFASPLSCAAPEAARATANSVPPRTNPTPLHRFIRAPPSFLSCSGSAIRATVDRPALHDERDRLHRLHVLQRVAPHRDNVRVGSRRDDAELSRHAE